MENKKNYQKILQNTLNSLKNNEKKPTLLLHVCCGPCLTIPLEILKDYFDITLYFNNSNIYPREEYNRRFDELKRYLKESNNEVNIIQSEYNNESFNLFLENYKDDKEGHERCRICFRARLENGFIYASKHHFSYFTTVMTISRYKNAQDINKIGLELGEKYPTTKWLCADFKKNNGYENSLLIIKKYHMYFQEYCGCKYSFRNSKKTT